MGLPSEVNWLVSFPKQSWSSSEMICWPISQPNSPEYHPVKFLSQPYPFLQKYLVMHSHLILGYPVHMKMHYAIFKIIYTICQYAYFQSTTITHMQLHTSIMTQSSSLEQIIIITNDLQHNLIPYNCVICVNTSSINLIIP